MKPKNLRQQTQGRESKDFYLNDEVKSTPLKLFYKITNSIIFYTKIKYTDFTLTSLLLH